MEKFILILVTIFLITGCKAEKTTPKDIKLDTILNSKDNFITISLPKNFKKRGKGYSDGKMFIAISTKQPKYIKELPSYLSRMERDIAKKFKNYKIIDKKLMKIDNRVVGLIKYGVKFKDKELIYNNFIVDRKHKYYNISLIINKSEKKGVKFDIDSLISFIKFNYDNKIDKKMDIVGNGDMILSIPDGWKEVEVGKKWEKDRETIKISLITTQKSATSAIKHYKMALNLNLEGFVSDKEEIFSDKTGGYLEGKYLDNGEKRAILVTFIDIYGYFYIITLDTLYKNYQNNKNYYQNIIKTAKQL